MKAEIKISDSLLRQLLDSIDKINSVPDEDEHADVFLIVRQNSIYLYSHVAPVFIGHTIRNGDEISVNIDEVGRICFNAKTLADIVKKSTKGELTIRFTDSEYQVITPSGEKLSAVQFHLPRFADSEFREPRNLNEFYSLDSVLRTELKNGLDMMSVLDEFVNVSLSEEGTLAISVHNKVNGNAAMETNANNSDLKEVSLHYMLRPMKEFASTITDAEELQLLVDRNRNICFRAEIDGWKAEMVLSEKVAPHKESVLEL